MQYTPIPVPKRLKQEDYKFDSSPGDILRLSQKYTKVEAGEIVQSIEVWACKHDVPSNLYLEGALVILAPGRWRKVDPRTHYLLPSLAVSVSSSWSVRDPV